MILQFDFDVRIKDGLRLVGVNHPKGARMFADYDSPRFEENAQRSLGRHIIGISRDTQNKTGHNN